MEEIICRHINKKKVFIIFILIQSIANRNKINAAGVEASPDCPCANRVLCQSLGRALLSNSSLPHVKIYEEKKHKPEVFAFVEECNSSTWSKFDWEKLTTIALFGFFDSQLTCHAHKHGVKVVKAVVPPMAVLTDPVERRHYALLQTSDAVLHFLDGVNLDLEDAVADGSAEQRGYTVLVQEMAKVLHDAIPDGQVSVDVPWSSQGVDGRYYDYPGLGQHADLLFIMAYDEQSQIWDEPCSARANSGLPRANSGVRSYTSLGIAATKLVLGLPWYGYNYTCISLLQNGTCLLQKVPFRGCPCSDAAGREVPYGVIRSIAAEYNISQRWDWPTSTPYYNMQVGDTWYQIRYDNPHSLLYKSVLSRREGLAGVGLWAANFLDYSDGGEAQRQHMWRVLP